MTLETFQMLYTVFLVLTIVFLTLSIVFFFMFDIRKIFDIKTGRAVRKSVEKLNEINRREDNRKRNKYKDDSGNIFSKEDKTEDLNVSTIEEETEVLVAPKNIIAETEVLVAPKNTMPETKVLNTFRDICKEVEDTQERKNVAIGFFNIIERKEVTFAEGIK